MFNIHPSAQANYDAKIRLLVSRLAEMPREKSHKSSFKLDIHANTITDKEIIGEIRESISDYRGKTVGRFFMLESKRYGLVDAHHEELEKLAEAIQRLPSFRNKLSQHFIEECIFSWLQNSVSKRNQSKSFMSFLIEEASKAIKPITVYVPIANTITEIPFRFCGATIRNLTKDMVDDMLSVAESIREEEQKSKAKNFFDDFRQKYQGYAIIELTLECEPNFANDFSINTANQITDLLGIYSGTVLIPDIKCISKIKGTENLAQSTMILKTEKGNFNIQQQLLDCASAKYWYISKTNLEDYFKCGLEIISEIVIKKQISEFESTVLNMALLYSKAAFTSDPLEKLVYMLSALESTLLKNESEPIQQNLAERLAVFISQELAERKAIIKNVKTVYGLRSRYLHHGHSSSDLDELSKFFFHVWLFYVELVARSHIFKSKMEFLDAIDDYKLG